MISNISAESSPEALLFCATQMTLLCLLALGVGALVLRRSPEWTSTITTLTLLTSLMLVLAWQTRVTKLAAVLNLQNEIQLRTSDLIASP